MPHSTSSHASAHAYRCHPRPQLTMVEYSPTGFPFACAVQLRLIALSGEASCACARQDNQSYTVSQCASRVPRSLGARVCACGRTDASGPMAEPVDCHAPARLQHIVYAVTCGPADQHQGCKAHCRKGRSHARACCNAWRAHRCERWSGRQGCIVSGALARGSGQRIHTAPRTDLEALHTRPVSWLRRRRSR